LEIDETIGTLRDMEENIDPPRMTVCHPRRVPSRNPRI
jgi:hypothetical protein